jgi:hypothetical protein
MKKGRWTAVGVCSFLVGAAIALLYLALRGSEVPYVPVLALGLIAITPLIASWLSGRTTPLVAGAGGLALGIAATVAASALDQGGTGAMPLALGVAVSGAIALNGDARMLWGRIGAVAIVAIYAFASGRVFSAAFAYPVLGFADELVDAISGRRSRSAKSRQAPTEADRPG